MASFQRCLARVASRQPRRGSKPLHLPGSPAQPLGPRRTRSPDHRVVAASTSASAALAIVGLGVGAIAVVSAIRASHVETESVTQKLEVTPKDWKERGQIESDSQRRPKKVFLWGNNR
jgi:hypothetical protein